MIDFVDMKTSAKQDHFLMKVAKSYKVTQKVPQLCKYWFWRFPMKTLQRLEEVLW